MVKLVEDVMTRNVVALRTYAQCKEIVVAMRERGYSAFPVLDARDTVVGVVSEDDLLVKEAFGPGGPARRLRPPR